MGATTKVRFARHRDVRHHSTWDADVPAEMFDDPKYFDADGRPTSQFDQWVCDNGRSIDVDLEEPEDDRLDYEIIEIF